MQFSFAEPQLSMRVRACRSLVWMQATLVLLGGAFVVFTAMVFGAGSSIPFAGDSLSGGRAAALGVVYLVAGLLLCHLGFELGGHRAPWARIGIVSLQVFLAVLLLLRSFELSLSVVINVAFFVSIVWLLAPADASSVPGSGTRDGAASSPASGVPEPTAASERSPRT